MKQDSPSYQPAHKGEALLGSAKWNQRGGVRHCLQQPSGVAGDL